MNFINGKELLHLCKEKNLTMSQVMIEREISFCQGSKDEIMARMVESYKIMKESARKALNGTEKSIGGLIGGEAIKLNNFTNERGSICGSTTSKAIAYAMGILEINASMGLIVAAPTAGSCGVLPGVLIALQEERNLKEEDIIDALFNASAVGYLAALNATISGAEGGCQAEVGTASAMAASAICQLMGASPEQCLAAAGFAFSNILGLVCDPIKGLVESPCQSRNAMGASNALVSAEIAMSGILAPVPFDEVVDAMYKVGQSLPMALRETAKGGIAACPSACSTCSA